MSYILDALNKSEQERRGQQTPDLQTVHRAPPPKTESKSPVLLVVGVLAVINIAGLVYWLLSDEETAQMSSAEPVTTQTAQSPAPAAAPINVATAPAEVVYPNNENASVSSSIQSATTAAIEANESGTLITPETIFQAPEEKSESRIRITELPINVQRQIPDLVFSSHLFSDEASFRMVNINGKMRREGDMVDNNLRLVEISEEGVVLGYRHYVFEVSVLRDWSFN